MVSKLFFLLLLIFELNQLFGRPLKPLPCNLLTNKIKNLTSQDFDSNLIDDFHKNYSTPSQLPKLEKLLNKINAS